MTISPPPYLHHGNNTHEHSSPTKNDSSANSPARATPMHHDGGSQNPSDMRTFPSITTTFNGEKIFPRRAKTSGTAMLQSEINTKKTTIEKLIACQKNIELLGNSFIAEVKESLEIGSRDDIDFTLQTLTEQINYALKTKIDSVPHEVKHQYALE